MKRFVPPTITNGEVLKLIFLMLACLESNAAISLSEVYGANWNALMCRQESRLQSNTAYCKRRYRYRILNAEESLSSQAFMFSIRAGSMEETDEEEYDIGVAETDEEAASDVELTPDNESQALVFALAKKTLFLFGKITLQSFILVKRSTKAGLKAAFSNEVEKELDDDNKPSLFKKLSSIMGAMWDAAINGTSTIDTEENLSDSDVEEQSETKISEKQQKKEKGRLDMGDYLVSVYKVPSSPSSTTNAPIIGGSLSDALRTCRSQARLLVAFIPASKPNSSKSKSLFDVTCIQSLRSEEVAHVMEGKKGSYLIWSAKYGSPEAVQAMKRLRISPVASGNKNLPTLVVAYPAQVLDKAGKLRLHPKLLAQHHCNPPPSETTLASFLTALRKRHSSLVKTMRNQLREAQLSAERKSNYHESMQSDTKREKQDAYAEAERKKKLQEEQKRLQMLQERRAQFMESLQEEPPASEAGVIAIAVRLADGRNAQRRFKSNENMDIIFNWIDGFFEWDRDIVSITTMRGDKKLEWSGSSDITIGDYAGPTAKMLGLRVSQKKEVGGEKNKLLESIQR